MRKEKVKMVRDICRHSNEQPLITHHLCMGRRGHCVDLCKGHPPWHTYLLSLFGI